MENITLKYKILRLLWYFVWLLMVRPFPRKIFRRWNISVLRLFGAKISSSALVYSSAEIYAPWNLEMGEKACIGPKVNCYNVDKIIFGKNAIVSQNSHLCSASHDITKKSHPLITAPIYINDHAWVAADAFVGMGVVLGKGSVVGARACVYKDVDPWTVVGGNPAKKIKTRTIE